MTLIFFHFLCFFFGRLSINIRIEVNLGILHWHSCQLTPTRGSHPLQSAITPTCHHPRRTPKQKCSSPWPRNCQMMLNKLDFSTISPCRRSKTKVLQTALNTWICLYFCINKSWCRWLVSLSFSILRIRDICKLVYKIPMYAEKIDVRYDPHSNPVWGSSIPPPTHTQHSQKLASMHWEMKGHGSRVNLWEGFRHDPCPLISQCKQKCVLQSLNNALSQGKTWIMLLASEDVNNGA